MLQAFNSGLLEYLTRKQKQRLTHSLLYYKDAKRCQESNPQQECFLVRRCVYISSSRIQPSNPTGCLTPKCPNLRHMIHAPVFTLQTSARVQSIELILTFLHLLLHPLYVFLFACSRPNTTQKMGFYEQILKDAGGKQWFIVYSPTLPCDLAKTKYLLPSLTSWHVYLGTSASVPHNLSL